MFDNHSLMMAHLKGKGFTVDNKDIFKGTEYAGTWDYTEPLKPGRGASTPVRVDLILKYR